MVDTTARQPHGTLAKHEAVEWARPVGPLRLPEVTAFASGAAQILAHHGGSLMLGGITELDPVDAAALAHHHDLLFLDGVQTLSPEAAAALARHRGGISLRGLRSLSPEVAAGIAGSAGGLWVDGITDLCPAAAAALAGHAGDLHLGALSKLSAETAAALATHHHQVTLPQLASLPADVARRLAAHDGRIILDGLEALSLEAALALAAHTGRLSLGGLTTLEPQVADALATHGGDLLLDGLASLSPTVAESLSHHRGWLSLAALKDLPPATAAALARHDGLVSLPPALRQEADAAGIPLPAHAGLARGRNGAEQKTRPLPSSKATPPKVIGVAIIGAGFGGLCMAIRLRDQGRSDFVIFDKEDSIGGTWRDNSYPGIACDVPSTPTRSHRKRIGPESMPDMPRFSTTYSLSPSGMVWSRMSKHGRQSSGWSGTRLGSCGNFWQPMAASFAPALSSLPSGASTFQACRGLPDWIPSPDPCCTRPAGGMTST